MGILEQNQREYYEGDNLGNYQFTSLQDVINQFVVAYVGEGKLVSKASKTDVTFHAMRAMQELSFDTFKSVKSQEIVLPPSLTMALPHDYVNYTQLSWSDAAGIKHPLYPTNKTSNPFSILQEEDGDYEFSDDVELLRDNSFNRTNGFHPRWKRTKLNRVQRLGQNSAPLTYLGFGGGFKINLGGGSLKFQHVAQPINPVNQLSHDSRVLSCWHKVKVEDMNILKISATVNLFQNTSTATIASATTHSRDVSDGEIVIGIQTTAGVSNSKTNGNAQQINTPGFLSRNLNDPDLGFMTFNSAGSDTTQEIDIDVSNYTEVFFIINSRIEATTSETLGDGVIGTTIPTQHKFINEVKEVSAMNGQSTVELIHRDFATENSLTSENFTSMTPRDSVNKYDDGTYDLVLGERYGIDPQHAQVNGSYFIDNLRGLINFSSNVSGKTVILDYISDSLGTDQEMQVHKFAQQALFMHIMYAILSTRANVPEYVVRRYKKEKFAATRQAKLRLSNIKTEEIIQILRGKSKWIKH